MDYVFDFYFGPPSIAQLGVEAQTQMFFIYEDPRFFSKIYVFLKSLGLIFYTTTLTRCENSFLFYLIMKGLMFLSTVNSARYEFRHYQRYGTVFSSVLEYYVWKSNLWPKTRIVFSFTELVLKMGYFIYIYPPQFEFSSVCDIGKSFLMIHILVLFIIYAITILFTMWLSFCICNYHNEQRVREPLPIQRPVTITMTMTVPAIVPFPVVVPSLDNECCICLDVSEAEAAREWIRLPCAHLFHRVCITQWLITHETCPICRQNVFSIV